MTAGLVQKSSMLLLPPCCEYQGLRAGSGGVSVGLSSQLIPADASCAQPSPANPCKPRSALFQPVLSSLAVQALHWGACPCTKGCRPAGWRYAVRDVATRAGASQEGCRHCQRGRARTCCHSGWTTRTPSCWPAPAAQGTWSQARHQQLLPMHLSRLHQTSLRWRLTNMSSACLSTPGVCIRAHVSPNIAVQALQAL